MTGRVRRKSESAEGSTALAMIKTTVVATGRPGGWMVLARWHDIPKYLTDGPLRVANRL